MNFLRELAVARDLARRAGARILSHYDSPVDVDYKGKGKSSPVTQADRDANELIVAGLRDAFPEDAILAEESRDSSARLDAGRLWCVDPLDGTREFIDKNGMFVVMIGLAVDGESSFGVVYQPTEDGLYWGYGGEAYFQAGDAEPVELRPRAVADASEAVMVVSRSHRSKTVTRVSETLGVVKEQPFGSVGLKATRLALGVADIYLSVSDRTMEWDVCAPEAIVRAAGGSVTDCRGAPLRYNKPQPNTPRGILATNGPLHPACVSALEPVARERGWL